MRLRCVLLLAACAAASAARPKIGIYPTIDTDKYMRAYQEWVGQEGADSVVFPVNFTDKVEELYQSVNGFLIPGGSRGLSPSAHAMIQRAVKGNDEGDYFPVWGTCLGFEWLVESFGGVHSIYKGFDSEGFPSAVNFTEYAKSSRTYAGANASLMNWLATEPVTYNNHVAGISPTAEAANKGLTAEFHVLSTSVDKKGKPFVAQIESKKHPIYGNQFHPEKVQFVHGSSYPNVPRSPEAVAVARYLAAFLVSETAKNKHKTGN